MSFQIRPSLLWPYHYHVTMIKFKKKHKSADTNGFESHDMLWKRLEVYLINRINGEFQIHHMEFKAVIIKPSVQDLGVGGCIIHLQWLSGETREADGYFLMWRSWVGL